MTVHDVICITHPHLIAPRSARLQRLQLKAARRADVVLTTCHATADAISALADVPSSRIVVASPGRLGGGFREDNPRPIREPYLLAVGALTPRKGFDVLAEAVSRLNKSMPILVVAGPDGWHAELVKQRLRAPDVAARVRLLGPVDDETLESLYQHAVLVCHPSRAEGFGIPCLEAMGFGKALVATDLPSTREIADGCARLVPVDDPSALVEAISELVADPHLRLNLGKQACARAVGFTWDATVESVVGAYRIATRQSGS